MNSNNAETYNCYDNGKHNSLLVGYQRLPIRLNTLIFIVYSSMLWATLQSSYLQEYARSRNIQKAFKSINRWCGNDGLFFNKKKLYI